MKSTHNNILFDKFEIIDCLKKDDFSSVYLANHIYLGKKIVLKVLDKKQIKDNSIIERFKREAKLLAKLDHPNIIKVLDFGLYDSQFYISFEYFKSNNLRHFIDENSFSKSEIKALLKQILLALDFAHQNKIIHRDIKPENIFIDDNLILKVGDFGLASSMGDSFVTQKASVVGTPAYMSPEQIQGEELDERSDLFSVGVVLYEIITGKSLFKGDDLNSTINSLLNFDPSSIEKELENIDNELVVTILQLLKYSRNDRPASAASVLEAVGYDKETISENQNGDRSFGLMFKKFASVIVIIAFSAVIFLITSLVSDVENETDKIDEKPERVNSLVDNVSDGEPLNKQVPESSELQNESSESSNTSKNNEPILDSTENLPYEKNTVQPEIISYGQVSINVLPWAYVYIDSQLIDSTPIDSSITLSAGMHQLLLKNPGYPDYITQIEIPDDDIRELTFSLDTLFSYLKVNVFPWGTVSIDDRVIGDTPLANFVVLSSGKHQLQITNPELGVFNREIELKKGDTTTLTYNFSGQKFILN